MDSFKNTHIVVYNATRPEWKTGYNIVYIVFEFLLISRVSVNSLPETC
jgi:hypothetical protein